MFNRKKIIERYLITTADEATWPLDLDCPVLFLGVWCKDHRRKNIWSKYDWIVAEPFLHVEKSINYEEYLITLFNQLLPELSNALNAFHKEMHSNRYWKIIIGHWLRLYLKVIIHRYKALNSTIQNYQISGVSVYKSNLFSLVTKNSLQFTRAINNSKWNSILFSKILYSLNQVNFSVNILDSDDKVELPIEKINKSMKRKFIRIVGSQLNRIYRDTDAFIVKTYLPHIDEIKLQASLLQVPKLWEEPTLDFGDVDPEYRSNFKLDYSNYQGLEMIVRKLIIELLPTCYLEGYKDICNRTETFKWPKSPKFIFTSNSFEHNEGFKFWTAKKVEKGHSYFVGQHGSNYGTYKYSNYWTEITTCDYFISWGWDKVYQDVNVLPAFNFIIGNKRNIQHDKNGSLLLIKRGPGQQNGPYDRRFIHSVYQQDVLSFFDSFPESIKKKFVVRLHHGSSEFASEDKLLWMNKYKNIKISTGYEPLNDLVANSRMVIITYDASSILVYLNLNIPLVCFWKDALDQLLDQAVPYYQLLIDVGIMHPNFNLASNHIIKYWDNIDHWWKSKKVQHARIQFCNRYSKKVNNPILTMSRLLKDNIKQQ